MIQTNKKISKAEAERIYKALLLPRLIEERMLNLLRQNKISKWFSGIGQEAISVATALTLDQNDYILPMHRNLGIFTTRGVPIYELFCQLLGKADGFTGGRDRSFHFGSIEHKIFGMISHLAATMPVADGIALAQKLKDSKQIAVSFCGDGATSEGDFHEALNLAGVWKLPVIFMIENNGYGLSTPISQQYACKDLVDRAMGYGLTGFKIDGNDFFSVQDTVQRARESALNGKPVLIEAETFRVRGHEEASGTFYVPDEKLEQWKEKDPILRFEKWMLENTHSKSKKRFDEIRKQVSGTFEDDLKQALAADDPIFDEETELKRAGLSPQPKPNNTSKIKDAKTSEKRFIDAIHFAQMQAFSEDESLILMGQDIAEYGGVFKATEGFVEEFGKERIRNTPIIESGAIGAAIGLAIEGFKPVVEMQFADFISCAYNQIVNNLSRARYRWTPDLNLTIRAPHGADVGAGPFHSESPEGWFMQHPGLRILVPSSVEDAQNMLYTAMFDSNPVLFFEHKRLYRSIRFVIADQCELIDIEKASVARKGSDISIITYGLGVHWAEEIADMYAEIGIDLEIIDLRSLAPIDWETVLQSVQKTNKVLLLQEPSEILGPMSEISSGIMEKGFEFLDAPVMRCSSLHTPVPFNKNLEQGYLAKNRLKETLDRLIEY